MGEASAEIVAAAVRRAGATAPDAAEGYLLSVDAAGAVVAGRDYRGALYGVSSFVQLVHRWGKQSVAVRQAVVRDWPFLPVRWVHLYLPGRDQLGFARRTMRDLLLRFKFNGIVLEVGGGMRLESHPEISVGWKRTVAEWYAHGETMDKLGEGIPLERRGASRPRSMSVSAAGRTSRRTTCGAWRNGPISTAWRSSPRCRRSPTPTTSPPPGATWPRTRPWPGPTPTARRTPSPTASTSTSWTSISTCCGRSACTSATTSGGPGPSAPVAAARTRERSTQKTS